MKKCRIIINEPKIDDWNGPWVSYLCLDVLQYIILFDDNTYLKILMNDYSTLIWILYRIQILWNGILQMTECDFLGILNSFINFRRKRFEADLEVNKVMKQSLFIKTIAININ